MLSIPSQQLPPKTLYGHATVLDRDALSVHSVGKKNQLGNADSLYYTYRIPAKQPKMVYTLI